MVRDLPLAGSPTRCLVVVAVMACVITRGRAATATTPGGAASARLIPLARMLIQSGELNPVGTTWWTRAPARVIATALIAAAISTVGQAARAGMPIPSAPPPAAAPVAVTNLRTGAGPSGEGAALDDGRFAFAASEADQQKDLNGDGDQTDAVLV